MAMLMAKNVAVKGNGVMKTSVRKIDFRVDPSFLLDFFEPIACNLPKEQRFQEVLLTS